MNKTISVTRGVTLAVIGSTIVLAAALVALFALGTKPAEAQAEDASITVRPSTIDLGDVAVAGTEPTTIKITNDGKSEVTIGGIDVDGAALGEIQLVDPDTGDELLDPVTGLLLNPLTILEGKDKVLQLVFAPTQSGPVQAVVKFLDNDPLTNTILDTVTLTGTARDCTVPGTPADDTLTDTPGDDVICGFDGNDTIIASNGGDDVVLGGTGNDKISIKDGVRKNDLANGGSGKDSCQKDKKDKVVKCGTEKRPK